MRHFQPDTLVTALHVKAFVGLGAVQDGLKEILARVSQVDVLQDWCCVVMG
jgi:hypothetical protein